MIRGIDHVGIAVKNLTEALKFYEEKLGLKKEGVEVVEGQKVRVASIPLGEARLELLEPTEPDSAVGRFLEKRGEGVHHISLLVDKIEEAMAKLRESGVELVDETPRRGAHGAKVAFIHPKSAFGVLLELCERENCNPER